MALVNCPECNRRVSDKAVSCPRCGYPFEEKKAMLEAANSGELGTAKKLIEQGTDVNARDEHGITPLMLAAFQSHAALVKELIDAGADVNAKRDGGYTALMDACYRGNPRVVEMLIQAGADVYAMNANGSTALMIAARNKQREVAALLRSAMDAAPRRQKSASRLAIPKQAPAAPAEKQETEAPKPAEAEATAKPIRNPSAEKESILIAGDRRNAFLEKARAEKERRMALEQSKTQVAKQPAVEPAAIPDKNDREEELVTCSRCNRKVTRDTYVCPNCGDLILLKFCPQCYKTIPQNAAACPHCGAISADHLADQKLRSHSSRLPLFLAGAVTFVVAALVILFALQRDTSIAERDESQETAIVQPQKQDESSKSTVPVRREANRRNERASTRVESNAGGREKTNQTESRSAEVTGQKRQRETQTIATEAVQNKNAIGRRLNSVGYRLLQEGKYGEAVSVLQQAVQAFPENTNDIHYAYALYNLGHALRLSGRPREAIPVLEQRLTIPDQQSTVMNELRAARRDAENREEPRPDEGQKTDQPEPPEDPEKRGERLNLEESQQQAEDPVPMEEPPAEEEMPEEDNTEEPPI